MDFVWIIWWIMYGLYDGFYMESLWIVIEWEISMDYIWIRHGLFGDLMGI